MTITRALEFVAIGLGCAVGGTIILLATLYVLTWLARIFGAEDVRIPPPVPRFDKLPPEDVDAVRAAAAVRRERGEARHREGRQIESGQTIEESRIIKLVDRR